MKRLFIMIMLAIFSLQMSAQVSGGMIKRGSSGGNSTAKKQHSTKRRQGSTFQRRSTVGTRTNYLRVDGYDTDINYNVVAEAVDYTYDVECSSDYNVVLLPHWCSLVKKTASYFVIRQIANTSTESRTSWFKVKAAYGKEIKISLTQKTNTTSGSGEYGYFGTTRTYTDQAIALNYLRERMGAWGECRTGAISEAGAGVAIYDANGYACMADTPSEMKDKLKEYNEKKYTIKDVALSNSMCWVVIYGKNGWYGVVPSEMKKKLNEYNENGEEIQSVSISPDGNYYTIVTDKHIHASSDTDFKGLKLAQEKFGHIYSACTTNKGLVVCCERGCYYSNIPTNVEKKIKELSFKPKVVKFTDSGTFLITDGEKNYSCYM